MIISLISINLIYIKYSKKNSQVIDISILYLLILDIISNLLEKYARLIVKSGVNIQKNQTLVITSPIDNPASVGLL